MCRLMFAQAPAEDISHLREQEPLRALFEMTAKPDAAFWSRFSSRNQDARSKVQVSKFQVPHRSEPPQVPLPQTQLPALQT